LGASSIVVVEVVIIIQTEECVAVAFIIFGMEVTEVPDAMAVSQGVMEWYRECTIAANAIRK
jgi:hypothetical protein